MGGTRSADLDALVAALPAWQVRAQQFNEAVAHRFGIAPSDLRCLFVLHRGGPSTPGALGAATGMTTGSASRMVDRLVAAGLVTREPDPADRRRMVVTIRPDAVRRLRALYDPLDDRLRDALDAMDDDALRQLRTFVAAAEALTADLTAELSG